MGYDLHITRAADWAANAGSEISRDEWLALIQSDPDLELAPKNGPYFANWHGASANPEPWLDWYAGNIHTKDPDGALLKKMVQLAERLGGRVQGDEGEFYSGDESLADVRTRIRKRSWWRRVFRR
jgi:hypothetical protein